MLPYLDIRLDEVPLKRGDSGVIALGLDEAHPKEPFFRAQKCSVLSHDVASCRFVTDLGLDLNVCMTT